MCIENEAEVKLMRLLSLARPGRRVEVGNGRVEDGRGDRDEMKRVVGIGLESRALVASGGLCRLVSKTRQTKGLSV